jgi:predicted peptidase
MIKRWFGWCLLTGLGIACQTVVGATAVAPTNSPKETTMLAPGIYQQTLDDSGQRYTIAIPEGYTGEQPVPLVMALHYSGTVTPFFGRGILEGLIEPALRDLGAIIVAPDASAGPWASPKGEESVLHVLDAIETEYNIDPGKILLTGYSMGGMGSWYIGGRNQERFTAVLPIAGRPQTDTTEIDWMIPLYIIHSRADELIDIAPTETAVSQLQLQGAEVELVIVDGITHYETNRFVEPLQTAVPWIKQAWNR